VHGHHSRTQAFPLPCPTCSWETTPVTSRGFALEAMHADVGLEKIHPGVGLEAILRGLGIENLHRGPGIETLNPGLGL
jgi:hypothetical protein